MAKSSRTYNHLSILFTNELESVTFSTESPPAEKEIISKNNPLLEKALRKLLKPPTLLMQAGGYFPYLLTPSNEIRTYVPLILFVNFQLFMHFVSVIVYISFQNDFAEIFGKFTETEKVTSTGFCFLGLFGQIVIRVSVWVNHSSYTQYHSSLKKLICELFGDYRSSVIDRESSTDTYLKWIMEGSTRVKRACLAIYGTVFVNILTFGVSMILFRPFVRLSILQNIMFCAITVDFLMAMFVFNGISIWLGSYIAMKGIALKIVKHRVQNDLQEGQLALPGINLLMQQIKQVEQLVDQFNGFSATYFITWFVFAVSTMVSQLYQNLLWIRYEFYHFSLASAPSLIAGTTAMYFVCTVSAELTTQGKQAVDLLSNRAVEEIHKIEETDDSIVFNKLFVTKVTFLHSKWQSKPSHISPGGYFILNKRLLTSIVGLMTTFLVVLLQFTNDGVPEWIKKWSASEDSPSIFSSSNDNMTIDVENNEIMGNGIC